MKKDKDFRCSSCNKSSDYLFLRVELHPEIWICERCFKKLHPEARILTINNVDCPRQAEEVEVR